MKANATQQSPWELREQQQVDNNSSHRQPLADDRSIHWSQSGYHFVLRPHLPANDDAVALVCKAHSNPQLLQSAARLAETSSAKARAKTS